MKRLLHPKNIFLLVGVFTIGFLFIAASGLESFEFSPGTPFSHLPEGDFSPYPPSVAFIFIMFGTLVLFILALFFLTPWSRRKIRLILAGMALVIAIIGIMAAAAALSQAVLPESLPTPLPEVTLRAEIPEEDPPFEAEEGIDIPHQEFEEPAISPWISFGLSLGLVSLVFLLAWLFLRERMQPEDERIALAEIAEQAMDEIKAGKDWGDAIINCYANMLQAVSESRKIILQNDSLTPAEFVALMVKARLPAAPVKRLTALFERVRYGGKQATQAEIDEAIACLEDIVAVCRENA
jgi:disulfide bond formation protein DsbB